MSAALSLLILLEAAVLSDALLPTGVQRSEAAENSPVTSRDGKPLYVREGPGRCTGDCLTAWPPFLATARDKPAGDFTIVKVADGMLQWSYKGNPVHTFAGDQVPGQAAGDGMRALGAQWHALKTLQAPPKLALPASATIGRQGSGFVLTDYRGHMLYAFDPDQEQRPACVSECLEVWQPLRAPALAVAVADWKPVGRPDGIRQWSYRGRLLYTFAWDTKPGEALGADAGGAWKIVPVGVEQGGARRTAARSSPAQAKQP